MNDMMNAEQWRRMMEVFEHARDLDAQQRIVMLHERCHEDAALRERVEAMLRAHDQTRSVLDEAAVRWGNGAEVDVPDPLVGRMVGRNRIVRRIARGGMGVVYEAEQEHPARRVALKVIQQGLVGRAAIRRFEFEAQILARLHHPGIAQIYEAGTFDLGAGGQPYFAMELIDGLPITTHAARNSLSTRQRIVMMIDVCEAVHHAHQRGVVHRDLKPGNILVSGDEQPKVLDFGVAKVTDVDVTMSTLLTSRDHVAGTVAYMSPEQLEGDSKRLDVLTDVYSLGVICYELLTGRLPYSADAGSMFEMMRQIREEPPARLSSFNRMLRGDLETILGKAHEKEPARRYASAAELAADLRAYLNDQPIAARPPSSMYQLKKFTKRNKVLVAGMATLFLVLVSALAVTSSLYVQAQEAMMDALAARDAEAEQRRIAQESEARALAAETEAKERAAELEVVAEFQANQLADIDPSIMGMRMREQVVSMRRTTLERDGRDEAEIPLGLHALDEALDGVNFTNLALNALDENIFQRAMATIARDFDNQPLVKSRLLQSLADAMNQVGLNTAAISPQEEALRIRRETLGEDHPQTMYSIRALGNLQIAGEDAEAAEAHLRRALELQRKYLGEKYPETLKTMQVLARFFSVNWRHDEAEDLLRRALAGQREVLGIDHTDTLETMTGLAAVLRLSGQLEESEEYHREALAARMRVLGAEDRRTLHTAASLGALLADRGRFSEAESFLRQALDGFRRVVGDDHELTLGSARELGAFLRQMGRFDEAEELLIKAAQGFRRTMGPDHLHSANALNSLAVLYDTRGDLSLAEEHFRKALDAHRRTRGENHALTLIARGGLAGVLRDQGQLAEAELQYRASLNGLRVALGGDHVHTITGMSNLSGLLRDLGRLDESADLAAEAVDSGRGALGNEHWLTAVALSQHGRTLALIERFEEAEACQLEAHAIFEAALGPAHDRTMRVAKLLADLYDAWHAADPGGGFDVKAVQWHAKFPLPEPTANDVVAEVKRE